MRALRAILFKEFIHHLRSYKLLILAVVFSLFGIISPLSARLLPELLAGLMPEGISMTLPVPTALDAWGQYFKNMSQMGLIVLALVFSAMMADDLADGRLTLLLTKGLRRPTVLAAKGVFMFAAWSLCVGWSCILSIAYTAFLFPDDSVSGLLPALSGLWLFGLMMLAVLLFCATLLKGTTGCLLGTGALMGMIALFGLIPPFAKGNPWQLITQATGLIGGTLSGEALTAPTITSLALMVLSLAGAVIVFNKKRL